MNGFCDNPTPKAHFTLIKRKKKKQKQKQEIQLRILNMKLPKKVIKKYGKVAEL